MRRLLLAIAIVARAASAAPPEMLPPNMDALTTDPVRDPDHPPTTLAVRLPGADGARDAMLYLAGGAEARPVLLLVQQDRDRDLDLAQTARRAGWTVLSVVCRDQADATTALAWLRNSATVGRYRLKPDRIVIAGDGVGSALAARVAAADTEIAGILLIAPADPASDLDGSVRALVDRPLLLIDAAGEVGATGHTAGDAARTGAPWITALTLPGDRDFSGQRVALATVMLKWLWTVPGRSVSFTGRPWQPDNIFARIIRGEIKIAKVYEDKYVLAFMDNHPQSIGHVLVISKVAHARNIMEMPLSELNRVMAVARRVAIAERAALHPQGVVIQQNNGNAQSVPHLHVHVYPSYRVTPWLSMPAPQADLADLEAVAAKLRAALPR